MTDILMQLFLFFSKAVILVVLILILVAGILALLSRGKGKAHGKMIIKSLNKAYQETKEHLLQEMLPKEHFKKFLKQEKILLKAKKKAQDQTPQKNLFVLDFNGDIKASAVSNLREEITAILGVATSEDEVIVRVESGGGMVNAYGLATSELLRLKQQQIPLTVAVDKVAASGGYLMASVADKILAAPFAIIGSIGVIVQLPNFHRLLKEKKIDFEQLTAGDFKRTLTLFGENTREGREKLLEEIENVHQLFKNVIEKYRPTVDIKKVSTGEHWLGSEAKELLLVDHLQTSDDYLLEKSKDMNLFEVHYQTKKSLGGRLTAAVNTFIKDNTYIKFPWV